MKTVVAAPDELWEELSSSLITTEVIRVNSATDFADFSEEDVYFNLFEEGYELTGQINNALVFINSPVNTLQENNQRENVFRINCWPGFLKRSKWEIAGAVNDKLVAYFLSLKKEFVATPDQPGFISSRILSMIINEAYFTLSEGVSTKQEIDVAMKLGTNYPKGPFEWSQEIGLNKVLDLLLKLAKEDARYSPATLLHKDSFAI